MFLGGRPKILSENDPFLDFPEKFPHSSTVDVDKIHMLSVYFRSSLFFLFIIVVVWHGFPRFSPFFYSPINQSWKRTCGESLHWLEQGPVGGSFRLPASGKTWEGKQKSQNEKCWTLSPSGYDRWRTMCDQSLLGVSQPSVCCWVPLFKRASVILRSICCCWRTHRLPRKPPFWKKYIPLFLRIS